MLTEALNPTMTLSRFCTMAVVLTAFLQHIESAGALRSRP
jgi:hypothetical protein